MSTPDEHRRQQELLGAFALGHLPEPELSEVRAHLEGCPSCRAELRDLTPVTDALRSVDTRAVDQPPVPPADLRARILQQVSVEQRLRDTSALEQRRARRTRTTTRWTAVAAAAALVLTGAVGVGTVVGRRTAPAVVTAPVIPMEVVPVATAPGLVAEDAAIIAHAWGVEARFDGRGFTEGERYRALFRAQDGRLLPAGEFLGTGEQTLTCNLQSALLRSAATGFVVLDADGAAVLSAQLPA